MKIVSLFLLSGTFLIAQQPPEIRPLRSFTGVKVSEKIELHLKKGNRESVKLEVDGTEPENVITEVAGDNLKIYFKPGQYKGVKVKALVTYVNLSRLTASSSAHAHAEEPIHSRHFRIHASSDATVDLLLEAEDAEVHVFSAAYVKLKGKATRLTADISSAGTLHALDFRADAVKADVSSAGTAYVYALQELEARASHAGTIGCKGNPPRLITHSSAAGTIKTLD